MAEDKKVPTGSGPGKRLDKRVAAKSGAATVNLIELRGQVLDALLSAQPKAGLLMISADRGGAGAKALLQRAIAVAAALDERQSMAAFVALLSKHLSGSALHDALAFVGLVNAGGDADGNAGASAGALVSIALSAHASDGSLLASLIDLDLGPKPPRNVQQLRDLLKHHFDERLIRRAHRLAMALTSKRAEADDLTQQAWLKLVENKRDRKAAELWRYICRNVVWRWKEGRRRDGGGNRFVSLDDADVPFDSGEARVLLRDILQVVVEEVGDLSPRNQLIIEALADGATLEELRPIVGSGKSGRRPVTDEAIKKARMRARQTLRENLPRAVRAVVKAPSKPRKSDSEEEEP